ncbi:Unknown protein sequence [Pseudomonas savastanoi pv. nerii]|nr:Unknown protein sequence [Pseudomonas savastanoi pv. nerii]KPY48725.1 Unknown protein sequence [Pseudomonas savastanoi pv. retacarpa]KPY71274.1 Unknown protein sequence [Pseudomonas savastanoi pv. savastanoi]
MGLISANSKVIRGPTTLVARDAASASILLEIVIGQSNLAEVRFWPISASHDRQKSTLSCTS